ncbi:MAG: 30S ribosomal protein S16 [Pseudomonadales bacterium]
MVTIRLARHGSKKSPFYHITVAESATSRDGRFIERIGFYNPVARGNDEKLRLDLDRAQHWLGVGAQASDRVKQLLAEARRNAGATAAAAAE